MFNEYVLLKRVEDTQGELSFASVQDSFVYQGEVVEVGEGSPLKIGDKVRFLKGSCEDMGDGLKAVKFEDIIKKM